MSSFILLIELGAGIGNFTNFLLDKELVIAVDHHEESYDILKQSYSDSENVIPLKMDITSSDILDLRKYNADSIVCINVLEHIEHDTESLSNMCKVLDNGGRLLLLVPAFQFLYGSHELYIHFRLAD